MLSEKEINNELYHSLGERWYLAKDDPVALLRAEADFRNPWILSTLRNHFTDSSRKILDIACGAGFLTNYLATYRYETTGVDLSSESLDVARQYDTSGAVSYREADALSLPFASETFDAVCLMDFLEHTDRPGDAIIEAARVLKPKGLLFFHTFNRNFISWLIVIKGMEWFVKNTPRNLHVLPLFIKPREMKKYLSKAGLKTKEIYGSRPCLDGAFFNLLRTGAVPDSFSFVRTPSLIMGYSGVAVKA
jgi:2-polyprenyl-6-hydroxyphenyl methylase/3-demethylubiquinone-9 3-methyltransferase